MGKLTKYQSLVEKLVTEYAEKYAIDDENTDQVIVIDNPNGVYQIYQIGWEGHSRIHEMTLHIRIKDGKIWVEEDWTEEGIASRLIESSVPNQDIVLGFNPPNMRQYTEYATA